MPPSEPPPGQAVAAESARALAARLLRSGVSPTQVAGAFLAVAVIVSGRGRQDGDDTDMIAFDAAARRLVQGADDGARTRNPRDGNPVLDQSSCVRVWCGTGVAGRRARRLRSAGRTRGPARRRGCRVRLCVICVWSVPRDAPLA